MAKKKAVKPKPRKPTARKVKRDTISGRYGDGEKAAEKLARRILWLLGFSVGMDGKEDFERQVESIKAELLAATSVEETRAKAIGAGWARKSELVETTWCVRAEKTRPTDFYVHIVRATPPKPRRERLR